MTISYNEAKHRFFLLKGEQIELCKEEYVSWTQEAKFYDKNNEEYFWSIPKNLFKCANKKTKRKITFQMAQQRFAKQGRTDIELCKEGFTGWSKKSKFYDKIVKKPFISIPSNVFKLKTVHPKRRKEKQKQTNVEKYGVVHPAQTKGTQDKIKQTNLKKYGVEHVFKSKAIKEKIKETNLEKYGIDHASKSAEVKNKIKQTNLKKYGVECVFQNKEIQSKIQQTSFERYGTSSPMKNKNIQKTFKQAINKKYGVNYISQSKKIKERIIRTNLEKYGVEHNFQRKEIREKTSKRYLSTTGEHLSDWYKKQPKPKPSYISLIQNFQNELVNFDELEKYFSAYKENKTSLEMIGETIFKVKHFNKKPHKEINKKPDFKITDTVYVNVDGLYWHSNAIIKNDNHHNELYNIFSKRHLTLFQFRENEMRNNPTLCKEIVESFNKNTNKQQHIVINNDLTENKIKTFLSKYNLCHSKFVNSKVVFVDDTENIIGVFNVTNKKNDFYIKNCCLKSGINIITLLELFIISQENLTSLTINLDLRFQHKEKNEILDRYNISESDCPVGINYLFTTGKKIVTKTDKHKKIYKLFDAGHIKICIPIQKYKNNERVP